MLPSVSVAGAGVTVRRRGRLGLLQLLRYSATLPNGVLV